MGLGPIPRGCGFKSCRAHQREVRFYRAFLFPKESSLADTPYRYVCRFLRYKHPLCEIPLCIIAIFMTIKFGVEVDFDVEFFIFLGDNDAVYQQPKISVADSSVFNNLFYNIDALFHFSLALFDGRIVVSNILAHEYKHFSHRGTGMRSLMDVYVFLNAHPNLDWNYINTELQKLKLTEYEKHSRNLAQKVFKNEALSEDETEQLMMYMDSSVYGTVRNMEYNSLTRKLDGKDTKGAKAKYFFNRFFLSGEALKNAYPFYYKHKYLLPILYIYRPIKGLITHPKGLARDTKRVVKYKSPKHRY